MHKIFILFLSHVSIHIINARVHNYTCICHHSCSIDAEMWWNHVQQFCQCHALPPSLEFLRECAAKGEWLPLLCHAQLYGIPPKDVSYERSQTYCINNYLLEFLIHVYYTISCTILYYTIHYTILYYCTLHCIVHNIMSCQLPYFLLVFSPPLGSTSC